MDNYRVVVTKEFGICSNFGTSRGTLGQGDLTFGRGLQVLRLVSGDGSYFF